MCTARLKNSPAQSLKRMVTKVQWLCSQGISSIKEQDDLFWTLTRQVHDNWVAYFRIWNRRSLHRFYWRAQTYENLSEVYNSRSRCTSRWHSRPKPFARSDLPRWTSSAQPQCSKIWGSVSGGDRVARTRAREAAWTLAKSVFKLEEQERVAFFSSPENRCLPASTLKPEEREFFVDSGASMHMVSKKDLNSSEMDTLTKSCSPAIVITANGEVQMPEEATVYVKELDIFLTMRVLEDTPAALSLGKLCDENGYSYEWINGQKPHLIKDGIRIICNTENFVPIVVPGLTSSSSGSSSTSRTPMRQESHSSSSSLSSPSSPTVGDLSVREREDVTNSDISPVPVSELVDDSSGRPDETQANETLKTNKKETTIERSDPLCSDNSEIPEWLQEFRENLVDDAIPLRGSSHASSSHEASLEPTIKRREDLGKHSVCSHVPKDRNCEICKRTKITRAPCRRRKGEAVLRAVNFGDLITADHKVLSDNCESRNNHRYAVVVQDLATQWIQAYPCQKQDFTRNPEKLAEVPATREETKSHLHWQFLRIRKSLWRSFMESLHVYTTPIGD